MLWSKHPALKGDALINQKWTIAAVVSDEHGTSLLSCVIYQRTGHLGSCGVDSREWLVQYGQSWRRQQRSEKTHPLHVPL